MLKYFHEDLQIKLFKFLISTKSNYTITLQIFINIIVFIIKYPILRLTLSLIRALCNLK